MVRRRWQTALSFLVAVLILLGLLWYLGPGVVVGVLRGTDPTLFGLGLLATLVSLFAWSEAQRTLLEASGATLSPWSGFLVYNVGMFAKQVLPMGHAVGPVLSAYAVGTELDRPYGQNLGPTSIAEFQILVGSVCTAVSGLGYLLMTAPTTSIDRTLELAVGAAVAVLVALPFVVWYRRRAVERWVRGMVWLLQSTVGRFSTRLSERLASESVADGLDRFYATLATTASDRRRTAIGFGWSLLGWIAFSLPLVTSAWALGANLSVASAFFIAPVVGILVLLPLPGGLGGSEVALTALLVAIGSLSAPTAAGVSLLYRLCTYWFVVLVGGGASAYRSLVRRRNNRDTGAA